MVLRIFLPYYSKSRGPPRLRFQIMGKRGKRFQVLVVANQRDPRDGKHMEVLGSLQRKPLNPIPSAIDEPHDSLSEIRLRFSRIKFWLGVGCDMNISVQKALAHANLIPPPPPKFGERTRGHYHLLSKIADQTSKMHLSKAKAFLQLDQPSFTERVEEPYVPDIEETPARIILEKLYPPEFKDLTRKTVNFDPIKDVEKEENTQVIRRIVR
ncbi:conserved hypothetical protein [Theileria equi strain WA]|uniref:30S ribosomal protein S16 n=1 Tax=Theileria equi strain WA TaxID=1537102 RepID=L1LEW2_THEEQ|nr:conserved hypothetical protein [Theileria equi strain WA]EKX73713.1 conserved hypothetical protein [Theileria equi strain WA]|eukprot:XP_004833165.1 conserved hypothetical protein [Theileria equi strain WA]